LLREDHLGIIALLMNLRNMTEAQVDPALVNEAIARKAPGSRALPFRFLTAAKHAPQFAQALSDGMCSAITGRLQGSTAVVVDVSGSMEGQLSGKSQMMQMDAAAALAVLFREVSASCRVFTFSQNLVEVPSLRGIGLVNGIAGSQQHSGTYLAGALTALRLHLPELDRLVVITDEQAADGIIAAWAPKAYLINVAPYAPGLDTVHGWSRVSGWSERVVDWIALEETGEILSAEED
jgi:hypothetical protein